MKLKSIAKNQIEIEFINGNYTITVFFSYATPVAAHVNNNMDKILVTTAKYSTTTTRHINAFIARYPGDVMNVKQSSIDNVLNFYTDK